MGEPWNREKQKMGEKLKADVTRWRTKRARNGRKKVLLLASRRPGQRVVWRQKKLTPLRQQRGERSYRGAKRMPEDTREKLGGAFSKRLANGTSQNSTVALGTMNFHGEALARNSSKWLLKGVLDNSTWLDLNRLPNTGYPVVGIPETPGNYETPRKSGANSSL